MKKYLIKLVMAMFTIVALLPLQVFASEVAEQTNNEVVISAAGGVRVVSAQAGIESAAAVQISLKIEPKNNSSVYFTFDSYLGAKVKDYRWHESSKILNIYVANDAALFDNNTTVLTIGMLSVTDESGNPVESNVTVKSVSFGTGTQIRKDSPNNTTTINAEGIPDEPEDIETLKSALKAALASALEKNAADYTAESYASLLEKIKAAQDILASDNATADELVTILGSLEKAMEALVPSAETGPEATQKAREELQELLKEVDLLDESDYTSEQMDVIRGWAEKAKEVLANPNAILEEITEVLDGLRKAMSNIRDFRLELKDELQKAKSYSSKDYTSASYNALLNAISAAEEVLNNLNATQKELEDALIELQLAMGALVPVNSGNSGNQKPSEDIRPGMNTGNGSNTGSGSNAGKGANSGAVKTGDDFPLIPMIVAIVCLAVIMIVLVIVKLSMNKNKKKNKKRKR